MGSNLEHFFLNTFSTEISKTFCGVEENAKLSRNEFVGVARDARVG